MNTLEVMFLTGSSSNLMRMFVLMMSGSSFDVCVIEKYYD